MNPPGNVAAVESMDDEMESLDLVCFSHVRWDSVFQRPQHLMTRFARTRRVFYFEEPLYDAAGPAYLEISERAGDITLVVPHLSNGDSTPNVSMLTLMNELFAQYEISEVILWYVTPLALKYTFHLRPALVVYDCIDELPSAPGVSSEIRRYESELFIWADVVFTTGCGLYQKERHPNVHPFPDGIDVDHFAKARLATKDPADQAAIPHPRLGYCGVIDERLNLALLDRLSQEGDWHIILSGPVCGIDPATLPRRENIHYLAGKSYDELPAYLAGWDVALLPFAINDTTRFMNSTNTAEYLAAGKPVVSTPVKDVVRPYGDQGLVFIARTASEFIEQADLALQMDHQSWWLRKVDRFLKVNSWDMTWSAMSKLMESAYLRRYGIRIAHQESPAPRLEKPPSPQSIEQPAIAG
jgi:UDP-galactopyranose mutase